MTKEECKTIVQMLAAAYPARPLSKESVQVWASQIVGKDFGFAVAATTQIVQTEDFMPSVSRWLSAYHAVRRAHETRNALPSGRDGILIPRSELTERIRELKSRQD